MLSNGDPVGVSPCRCWRSVGHGRPSDTDHGRRRSVVSVGRLSSVLRSVVPSLSPSRPWSGASVRRGGRFKLSAAVVRAVCRAVSLLWFGVLPSVGGRSVGRVTPGRRLSICPGVCLTRSGRLPLPPFAVVRAVARLPLRSVRCQPPSVRLNQARPRPGVVPFIVPKVRRPIARERSGRCCHLGRVEPVPGLTLSPVRSCRVLLDPCPVSLPSVCPSAVAAVGVPRRGVYGRSCVGCRSCHCKREPRRPFPRRGVSLLAMGFSVGWC